MMLAEAADGEEDAAAMTMVVVVVVIKVLGVVLRVR